jgi:hypothetical protein
MTHKNGCAGCSFLSIFKTLDPDSLEMLDPDPDLMNLDTQTACNLPIFPVLAIA